jgi:hypothetical protein
MSSPLWYFEGHVITLGLRLRMGEVPIATAIQFYHMFQKEMRAGPTDFDNHVRNAMLSCMHLSVSCYGNALPCH